MVLPLQGSLSQEPWTGAVQSSGSIRSKGTDLRGRGQGRGFIGRLIRLLKIVGPMQVEDLFSLREKKSLFLLLALYFNLLSISQFEISDS